MPQTLTINGNFTVNSGQLAPATQWTWQQDFPVPGKQQATIPVSFTNRHNQVPVVMVALNWKLASTPEVDVQIAGRTQVGMSVVITTQNDLAYEAAVSYVSIG